MTITREWLAHHTGWENCWCGNTRASQRPDKRVRYIYRKYAGSSGITTMPTSILSMWAFIIILYNFSNKSIGPKGPDKRVRYIYRKYAGSSGITTMPTSILSMWAFIIILYNFSNKSIGPKGQYLTILFQVAY